MYMAATPDPVGPAGGIGPLRFSSDARGGAQLSVWLVPSFTRLWPCLVQLRVRAVGSGSPREVRSGQVRLPFGGGPCSSSDEEGVYFLGGVLVQRLDTIFRCGLGAASREAREKWGEGRRPQGPLAGARISLRRCRTRVGGGGVLWCRLDCRSVGTLGLEGFGDAGDTHQLSSGLGEARACPMMEQVATRCFVMELRVPSWRVGGTRGGATAVDADWGLVGPGRPGLAALGRRVARYGRKPGEGSLLFIGQEAARLSREAQAGTDGRPEGRPMESIDP